MKSITRTELHTHLMGMLSGEAFFNFLAEFDNEFRVPVDYNFLINFDDNTPFTATINDICLFNKAGNMRKISIPHGETMPYSSLNDIYFTRGALLAKLIDFLSKKNNENANDIKAMVYTKYLEACLKELILQGVEYVEISFSNNKLIPEMVQRLDKSLLDNIQYRFLLSTDRKKQYKDFNQSSRYLEKLIQDGYCVGFDMMGSENAITDIEKDDKSNMSIFRKLTPIIEKLHKKDNTTLRIHSGETYVSEYNTAMILKILKQIKQTLKIEIPPPEIRIGHAIHFINNKNYIDLLKEFKCAIEINASSNYALSNVATYKEIPYEYYLDNGIDVVLSTDGHGVYDTSIKKENVIANYVIGDDKMDKVIDYDNKVLNDKKGVR